MLNIDLTLLISKGICGMILHLAMQSNVDQGNEMMKFALNHSDLFLNYTIAFKIGLTSYLTSLAVETISLLIIWTSESVQDVVFNFIALAVIDQFDQFVYDTLRSESFKKLLEEDLQKQLLKISFTTSSSALSGEMGEASDQVDEDGKPLCNKLLFWNDRSFINKVYWLVYKLMRFYYVVAYFYFYPMSIIVGNFAASYHLSPIIQ